MISHTLRQTACAFGALVLSGCLVVLIPASVAAASPTNAEIEAAKKDAAEAHERLGELQADLEERSEEYLAAEEELSQTRHLIQIAEEELVAAEAELRRAEKKLNDRALSIYRNGGVDVISMVLGVTDFRDLVTRLELFRRVSASDAALVSAVKTARSEAEKTRQSLENRRSEQVVLLRRSKEKKHEVEVVLERQRSYLAGVDSRLETLIAEERERQERIARERAAAEATRLAEQARTQAERAAAAGSEGEGPGDQGTTGSPAGAPASSNGLSAPGSPGPATAVGALPPARTGVLSVARSFIGVTPYVWGGVTPAGFDCSGLTMYCYREIGVNIPRTSRQQYTHGSRIPADRLDMLRPGDLVFFARDADPGRIHHVGIYSGNGNYVHAPQAGELVTEASLLGRIAVRGDYVGAVRP